MRMARLLWYHSGSALIAVLVAASAAAAAATTSAPRAPGWLPVASTSRAVLLLGMTAGSPQKPDADVMLTA
jgi:hypothetical protein